MYILNQNFAEFYTTLLLKFDTNCPFFIMCCFILFLLHFCIGYNISIYFFICVKMCIL